MNRNVTRAVAVAALLVAVGVGVVVATHHHSDRRRQAKAAAAATTDPSMSPSMDPPTNLSVKRMDAIASDLGSGQQTKIADALDPVAAARLAATGKFPVPRGSSVQLLANTQHVAGQTATVTAVVTAPHGKPTQYTMLLVLEGGRWLVVSTTKQ
jgi:hypothetical protein